MSERIEKDKDWIEKNPDYLSRIVPFCLTFGFFIVLTIFFLKQYFPSSYDSLNLINAAILFWTGIVLVIYTYQTYKLREIAQRQIEIQQRPFVILEMGSFSSEELPGFPSDYTFRVRNVGVSTAINVRVIDVFPEGSDWGYRFPCITPVLLVHEVNHIHPQRIPRKDKPIVTESIYERLDWHDFTCRVQFYNVEMTLYSVVHKYLQGQLYIVDSGPMRGKG